MARNPPATPAISAAPADLAALAALAAPAISATLAALAGHAAPSAVSRVAEFSLQATTPTPASHRDAAPYHGEAAGWGPKVKPGHCETMRPPVRREPLYLKPNIHDLIGGSGSVGGECGRACNSTTSSNTMSDPGNTNGSTTSRLNF